jgi:hypothetical protein
MDVIFMAAADVSQILPLLVVITTRLERPMVCTTPMAITLAICRIFKPTLKAM